MPRQIIPLLFIFLATPATAFAVPLPSIDCSRPAGSVVDPSRPLGSPDSSIPIEHIVVLMQENHSFDSYLGRLEYDGYEGEVDGIDGSMWNPDASGREVHAFHQSDYCPKNPDHTWNAAHLSWDDGRDDGFVLANGDDGIGYYDQSDLSFLYALANRFAIADRYFCSVMSSTYPNRFFYLTGTAFGHISNDLPVFGVQFRQRTIFDELSEHGVDWRYYYSNAPFYAYFGPSFAANAGHVKKIDELFKDLRGGRLPAVSFIDPSFGHNDEEPPQDFQVGQANVSSIVHQLIASPDWKNSALILTYDENGGFYDHVPPPEACEPDDEPPNLNEGDYQAQYDHYGFRVPLIVVSPYAKKHYVSHIVYDHTSILKLIETKYNLPALTRRDANADPMLDLFDFAKPVLDASGIPEATIDPAELDRCSQRTDGENGDPDEMGDLD